MLSSFENFYHPDELITKQLRAKSTPGTRSSLGVSSIATQEEEDKFQTFVEISK